MTTPEGTVLDLSALVDGETLSDIIEFFVARKLLTERGLVKLLLDERLRWARGLPSLRRLLVARMVPGLTEASLAAATDRLLLLRAGVDVPVRDFPFVDGKGRRFILPLVFPEHRLAVFPRDELKPAAQTPSWFYGLMLSLQDAGWSAHHVPFQLLTKRPRVHGLNLKYRLSERARQLGVASPVDARPGAQA